MDKTLKTHDLATVWASISTTVKGEVSADTFARWFRDIDLVELDEKNVTLRVPNNIYQLWIEKNFLPLLRSAFLLTLGADRIIQFVSSENTASATVVSTETARKAQTAQTEPVETMPEPRASFGCGEGMNPRNTFEAFVIGPTNQFAHAACIAVAESPAKRYNPLFIYGGVGLGKTHLMHAIGHGIRAKKKQGKVLYVSSEAFTNEFIDAIQNNSLIKFRKRYRQADVLLIDDIQFLADKGRTQEEFFHTFNTLFDGHKQIVLSSDRPPCELAGLEQRLVSRFDWGCTAELLPPDAETREAILRKKAQSLEVPIAESMIHFLAVNVRTNVRILEGALTRVATYASLSGNMPSLEKAEHLLRDILQQQARRTISIDQIQKRVAEQFDIRIADMTSKRRPNNIAFPRQIAMYLARELTKTSLSEIGEAFGGRDHGTVLHAHRLVKDRMLTDEKIRQTIGMLESQLSR